MTASLDPRWLDQALTVARTAADAAAIEIRRHYRQPVAVRLKSDSSPVTVADEAAEMAIRAVLRQAFPGHAIFGEEFGREDNGRSFLWLIDPIDGTKSYIRGYPMFSTQLALMYEGELVLGVSAASEFGETAWARRGGGAWLNGVPVRLSATPSLAQATLSFGNIKRLACSKAWPRLAELVAAADRTRGYGDFYHYHLLACGAVDLVIESDVNILDIAALAVITREAGGVFTDLNGQSLTLSTTSVLAGNANLHAAVLPLLVGAVE